MLTCFGLGHMPSWWSGQGYSSPPSSPPPCLYWSCQASPATTKLPWDSPLVQPTEQSGHACWWTIRERTQVRSYLQSRTGQRPQGGGSNHWETSRDTHIENLTPEDPPATDHTTSHMALKVHCKTRELIVLKRMFTFHQTWVLGIFHYHFRSQHVPELCVSRNGWTMKKDTHSLSLTEIHCKKVLPRRQPSLTLCNTANLLAHTDTWLCHTTNGFLIHPTKWVFIYISAHT